MRTATFWSSDPRAHIAVYRPPCGRAGCGKGCATWARCRCRVVLGRCEDHIGAEPLSKLRAEHRCAEAVA